VFNVFKGRVVGGDERNTMADGIVGAQESDLAWSLVVNNIQVQFFDCFGLGGK